MRTIATAWVVLLGVALAGAAAPIPGLVSTGGATPGSQDPVWQWFYSPTPTQTYSFVPAWVTDDAGYPFPYWAANSPGSSWISPQQGYGNSYGNYADAVGYHYFLLMYDIPAGYDPDTATFTFNMAADNLLNSMWVNSTMVMNGGVIGYSAMQGTFTIGPTPGLFRNGPNSLVVIIYNEDLPSPPDPENWFTWNPVGVRIEILSSNVESIPGSEIPEPGALYLCAAGLFALGLMRRRKQA